MAYPRISAALHGSAFRRFVLLSIVSLLLIGGLVGQAFGVPVARQLWFAAIIATIVPEAAWVLADLRRRRYGADLLALVALVGTAAVGEYFAGAVVALMVSTGRVLDSYAGVRARRDLSELLARAPVRAHRRCALGVETVGIEAIAEGDTVVVLPGETVPVDGVVTAEAIFDESALTGEPVPAVRASGTRVRSGVINCGVAVDIRATASAEASTYAGIVALAAQAAATSAPVARLADRIAMWFLPVALTIAGVAWWGSGDAVRAVSVVVTATPCPLLLAVPIAITAGMSRTASAGVVVKSGAALEALGRATTLAIDKTGTVTCGRPEVTDIVCAPGVDESRLLQAAASVEQFSTHVLATAVIARARNSGVVFPAARDVTEIPGRGVQGEVDGSLVTVGRFAGSQPEWAANANRRAELDLASIVWVSVGSELLGALLIRDRLRSDAPRTMRRLRAVGFHRLLLLTGDRLDNAADIARLLGMDEVRADASPADKIATILAERVRAVTVMVGDGINDAPALAAADVGIALGSRGSTAAVQSADAVIIDDRIDRLADTVEIAQRAHRLALQSALGGTVASVLAMVVAAAGLLVPAVGAIVQEGIDVVVILNALRMLRTHRQRRARDLAPLISRFAREHDELRTARAAVRRAADGLAHGASPTATEAVRDALAALDDFVLPHEYAEERQLYPAVTAYLRDPEALVTMSREHAEIARLSDRIRRHLADSTGEVVDSQIDDLRATLYGLDAILSLHFAQEDEALFSLAGDALPR